MFASAINGVIMILPPFAFFRGLRDLSAFTTFGGTGITWDDILYGAADGMRASSTFAVHVCRCCVDVML